MMSREIRTCLYGLGLTVISGALLFFLGTATTLPGPDSKETLFNTQGELVSIAHGLYRKDTFVSVLGSLDHTVTDASFVDVRESFVKLLRDAKDAEGSLIFESVKTLGHSWAQDDLFISNDNHHLLILAEGRQPVYQSPAIMKDFVKAVESWKNENPAFSLSYSSSGVVSDELFSLINTDLDTSLKYTVPITIMMLVWTFGAVGASIMAMFVTGLSLIASLGIASLVSHLVHPISATAAQLVVLIVMAIGTDYALFYITRFRQEMSRGITSKLALKRTSSTTGVAILWSGITVAASLTGLLLVNDPILTSMAAVSIIAVIVTLVYTSKVLPALLVLTGEWIEWGNIRSAVGQANSTQNKWVVFSIRYPMTALTVSVLCLLSVGYFSTEMNLGSTMQSKLMPQEMQSSQAIEALNTFFPKLSGTDLALVLHAKDLGNKDDSDTLEPFFDALLAEDRLHGPVAIDWSDDRTTARYNFKVVGSSQDDENRRLVHKLKEEVFPAYLGGLGVQGYLTGKLNFDIEQQEFHKKKIVVVIGAILGVSLIFLMIAFESIVVPLKAFLLNVLSTAAAFGLLVLLFQSHGWRYGVIETFVPSLLFSILFGLSMDYHLLLISRIREYVNEGFETRTAVIHAITETYGVISGAAAIMTSVFIVISFLELPLMKQLGIGLACAVILDATIVRCILLPASVVLLGDKNWYMAKSLKTLIRKGKVSRPSPSLHVTA